MAPLSTATVMTATTFNPHVCRKRCDPPPEVPNLAWSISTGPVKNISPPTSTIPSAVNTVGLSAVQTVETVSPPSAIVQAPAANTGGGMLHTTSEKNNGDSFVRKSIKYLIPHARRDALQSGLLRAGFRVSPFTLASGEVVEKQENHSSYFDNRYGQPGHVVTIYYIVLDRAIYC